MAIKGTYVPPNNKPIRPFPDPSMPNATASLTAGQTAAFLLLSNSFSPSGGFPFISADTDTPDGISPLGTPVFGRIILGEEGKDGANGEVNEYTDSQGKKGSYKTVELDCALISSVDYNNKIVKTDIQGLPYSITEFISNGDNDVTITGIFNSTPGIAPLDFIFNLHCIFSAPVPIPVTNYYLNLIGINFIKICPGTTMGQSEGAYASQTFTIKAMSDVPMSEMLP